VRILGSIRVAGVVTALALATAAPAESAQTAAADTLPRPVTLEEAVALARQNAPGIIQAEGQKRTSAAGVRSAYAAFLPSVSLSAGASRQLPATGSRTRVENGQVITVPTDPWSSNIGLGASVTLFEGGRRITDLQQAHGQADAAEVNSVVQVYATTLSVKQQLFNLLAARETEMAARSQLEQAEQQRRTAIAQVRARTATRSDSLRAEIQVRSARLALMDARDAQEVAVTGLTRAAGSPYPITAAETDSVAYTGLALSEEALRELAENAPGVRLAQTALASAHAARRGTWAGYLPSVTAGYSRGGSGTSAGFALGTDDYSYSGSLRLSLSLPLFNQLQREGQVTQAQVAVENAAAELRDARLAARGTCTQLLVAFRSAWERAASQELSVETAAEDLRVQQARYAVGQSTLLDVLTSQTQMDQARRDLIRARYDQRIAKAQLEALLGQDL
jgi:outer membrane protein